MLILSCNFLHDFSTLSFWLSDLSLLNMSTRTGTQKQLNYNHFTARNPLLSCLVISLSLLMRVGSTRPLQCFQPLCRWAGEVQQFKPSIITLFKQIKLNRLFYLSHIFFLVICRRSSNAYDMSGVTVWPTNFSSPFFPVCKNVTPFRQHYPQHLNVVYSDYSSSLASN